MLWVAADEVHQRKKRGQLRLFLRGQITEHHRYLLAELMENLERAARRLSQRLEKLGCDVILRP